MAFLLPSPAGQPRRHAIDDHASSLQGSTRYLCRALRWNTRALPGRRLGALGFGAGGPPESRTLMIITSDADLAPAPNAWPLRSLERNTRYRHLPDAFFTNGPAARKTWTSRQLLPAYEGTKQALVQPAWAYIRQPGRGGLADRSWATKDSERAKRHTHTLLYIQYTRPERAHAFSRFEATHTACPASTRGPTLVYLPIHTPLACSPGAHPSPLKEARLPNLTGSPEEPEAPPTCLLFRFLHFVHHQKSHDQKKMQRGPSVNSTA
ncbi:hypothetical protein F5X68DRAFT_8109 [Plectosphaerella plurivora]|uniref:Uncharacterized protein n=1 Tax=Plectosphaerella plurivora TaxID=936078 RepID=A0A9P8VBF5_9PEZI|nr:hypothetical protein F5X68DRAFT_8109 [Plectosphaerella plurivora]